VITRKGFSSVVRNAFAGMGFSAEAPTTKELPLEMFLPGSDLTPIQENIDTLVYGLTQWQPTIKEKKIQPPPKIIVEGDDYESALFNMNNLFLKNLWSDGLPLLPPTEERVNWILSGSSLPPETVIGKILPRGGIATVETLSINLAMAGGRPEYLPVLIAAIEAMVAPEVMHQVFNATTCSVYPAVMINGPVAKQIRLGWGYGCLGPNPQFPAGAAIGRAIRLILMGVGGAVPGIGSMSIFGGANRFTNIVFAEDEEGLPQSWEPLNTSYFGYPRGSNTVSIHPVASTVNIADASVGTSETAMSVLHMFAGMMGIPNWNSWGKSNLFEYAPGILLIPRGSIQNLVKLGWSREKMQDFLWENSKVPWSTIKNTCPFEKVEIPYEQHKTFLSLNQPWPITSKAKNIMIVIAGGEQSGHGYWMQRGTSFQPMCKEIQLPSNWEALLKKAEDDLGPVPEAR
jgi:hypothetical protein